MTTMELILPVLERGHTWIVYLQNAVTPTISLVLYIIEDLIQVSEKLAESAASASFSDTKFFLILLQPQRMREYSTLLETS